MNNNVSKYLFLLSAAILVLAGLNSCVESLTNSQQSSSTPTITVYSPATGDSVQVGDNLVSYEAADGVNGEGLSFFEVYLNGKFIKRYELNTDGTNPDIYLTVDSTLLGLRINYYIKVYNSASKSKASDTQENIYVKDKVPDSPANLILTKLNDFTLPANYISTDDAGLSAFSDYFYKVRAFNTSGYSGFSNEVSTSSVAGGPWNLQAEAIGASSIHLTWTDFAVNELGFRIERTNPSTTEFELIAISPRGSTEFYDNTVQANTGYIYRIAYYTNTSVSGYSNEVSIATYYTDIDGPSNLSLYFNSTFNAVMINWENNNEVAKETIIERKTGTSGSYSEIQTVDPDSTYSYDYAISSGQTYIYRLRQKLGNKTFTQYSNEAEIKIP